MFFVRDIKLVKQILQDQKNSVADFFKRHGSKTNKQFIAWINK